MGLVKSTSGGLPRTNRNRFRRLRAWEPSGSGARPEPRFRGVDRVEGLENLRWRLDLKTHNPLKRFREVQRRVLSRSGARVELRLGGVPTEVPRESGRRGHARSIRDGGVRARNFRNLYLAERPKRASFTPGAGTGCRETGQGGGGGGSGGRLVSMKIRTQNVSLPSPPRPPAFVQQVGGRSGRANNPGELQRSSQLPALIMSTTSSVDGGRLASGAAAAAAADAAASCRRKASHLSFSIKALRRSSCTSTSCCTPDRRFGAAPVGRGVVAH